MARQFFITAVVKSRVEGLDATVSQIKSKLSGLNAQVSVSANSASLKNFNSNVQNTQSLLNSVQKNASIASQALGNIGRNTGGITAFNRAISGMGNDLNKLKVQTASVSSEFTKFGLQVGQTARRYTAFALFASAFYAVGAAAKEGVAQALKFDRELVRIAQVGGDSVKTIKSLSQAVSDLSTSLGVSSQELVETATTLRQAGLSANEVKDALSSLAKTSLTPTFKSIKNTTEGVIALRQQFGITGKEIESVLGSINTVSAQFAVESDDLVTAISKAGGAFRAASGDMVPAKEQFQQLISLFTAVRSTTRESADSIATSFRTIFARLQSNEVNKNLKEMGVNLRFTSDEAKNLGQNVEGQFVGMYDAIGRLSNAVKNIPTTDPRYSAIIEQAGGQRQVSKVIPLLQQYALAQKALGVAQAGTTSLTKDAATAQEALITKVTKLKEEFFDLIRVFGENKTFKSFVGTAIDMATAFTKLAKALEPVVPLLATVAAVQTFRAASFIVPAISRGIGGQRFAAGGVVPGSGSGDIVPASVQPGSFIVKKASARSFGYGNLDRLVNGGGGRGYAKGGAVPVMLEPQEYYVPPEAAQRIGYNTLKRINAGQVRRESNTHPMLAMPDFSRADNPGKEERYYRLHRAMETKRKIASAKAGKNLSVSDMLAGRYAKGGTIADQLPNLATDFSRSLSDEEKLSVSKYGAGHYSKYNTLLRNSSSGINASRHNSGELKETVSGVRHIENAISKENVVTPKTSYVYRGVEYFDNKIPKVGHEFVEHGFLSTSTNRDAAMEFAGSSLQPGHLMKIRIPKGTPAGFLGHLGTHKEEEEIFFGSGARLKYRGGKGRVLRFDLVGFDKSHLNNLPGYASGGIVDKSKRAIGAMGNTLSANLFANTDASYHVGSPKMIALMAAEALARKGIKKLKSKGYKVPGFAEGGITPEDKEYLENTPLIEKKRKERESARGRAEKRMGFGSLIGTSKDKTYLEILREKISGHARVNHKLDEVHSLLNQGSDIVSPTASRLDLNNDDVVSSLQQQLKDSESKKGIPKPGLLEGIFHRFGIKVGNPATEGVSGVFSGRPSSELKFGSKAYYEAKSREEPIPSPIGHKEIIDRDSFEVEKLRRMGGIPKTVENAESLVSSVNVDTPVRIRKGLSGRVRGTFPQDVTDRLQQTFPGVDPNAVASYQEVPQSALPAPNVNAQFKGGVISMSEDKRDKPGIVEHELTHGIDRLVGGGSHASAISGHPFNELGTQAAAHIAENTPGLKEAYEKMGKVITPSEGFGRLAEVISTPNHPLANHPDVKPLVDKFKDTVVSAAQHIAPITEQSSIRAVGRNTADRLAEAQRKRELRKNIGAFSVLPERAVPLPSMNMANVPSYIAEELQRRRDMADRLGITQDIHKHALSGLTADQIRRKLDGRFGTIKTPGEQNEIIRGTRAHLGVPSVDQPEFKEYQRKYSGGGNTTLSSPSSPTATSGGVSLPIISVHDKMKDEFIRKQLMGSSSDIMSGKKLLNGKNTPERILEAERLRFLRRNIGLSSPVSFSEKSSGMEDVTASNVDASQPHGDRFGSSHEEEGVKPKRKQGRPRKEDRTTAEHLAAEATRNASSSTHTGPHSVDPSTGTSAISPPGGRKPPTDTATGGSDEDRPKHYDEYHDFLSTYQAGERVRTNIPSYEDYVKEYHSDDGHEDRSKPNKRRRRAAKTASSVASATTGVHPTDQKMIDILSKILTAVQKTNDKKCKPDSCKGESTNKDSSKPKKSKGKVVDGLPSPSSDIGNIDISSTGGVSQKSNHVKHGFDLDPGMVHSVSGDYLKEFVKMEHNTQGNHASNPLWEDRIRDINNSKESNVYDLAPRHASSNIDARGEVGEYAVDLRGTSLDNNSFTTRASEERYQDYLNRHKEDSINRRNTRGRGQSIDNLAFDAVSNINVEPSHVDTYEVGEASHSKNRVGDRIYAAEGVGKEFEKPITLEREVVRGTKDYDSRGNKRQLKKETSKEVLERLQRETSRINKEGHIDDYIGEEFFTGSSSPLKRGKLPSGGSPHIPSSGGGPPDDPDDPTKKKSGFRDKFSKYGTLGLSVVAVAGGLSSYATDPIFGTPDQIGKYSSTSIKTGAAINGTLAGVTSGAAIGSVFGPIGAVVGGVVGALAGFTKGLVDAEKKIKQVEIEKDLKKFGTALEDILSGKSDFGSKISQVNTGLDAANKAAAITSGGTLATEQSGLFSRPLETIYDFFKNTVTNKVANVAGYDNVFKPGEEIARNRENDFAKARKAQLEPLLPSLTGVAEGVASKIKLTTGDISNARDSKDFSGVQQKLEQSGIGNVVSSIAEAKGTSIKEVYESLHKVALAANQETQIREKGITVLNQQLIQSQQLLRISQAFGSAASSLHNLQSDADALASSFDNIISATPATNHSANLEIGGVDTDAFNKSTDFVSNSIGGKTGASLGSTAKGINKAFSALPDVLSSISSQGLSGSNLQKTASDSLDTSAFDDIPDEIKSSLKNVLDSIDPKDLEEAIKNPERLAGELLSKGFGNISETLQKAGKELEDRLNGYSQGLVKYQEMLNSSIQGKDKSNNLNVNAMRSRSRLFAEANGRPSDGGDIPLASALKPFQLNQQNLTGLSAKDSLSPEKIGEALQSTQKEIDSTRENSKGAGNAQDSGEFLKKLESLKGTAQRLNQALGNLAETSGRNALIQEKINKLEEDKAGRTSFTEKFLTADHAGRRDMAHGAALTDIAVQQGHLGNFNDKQRQAVLSHLDSVSGVKLQGPGYNNTFGKDVKNNLIQNTGKLLGVGGFNPNQDKQRIGLLGEQAKNDTDAVKAQQEINKNQESLQQKFYEKLESIQASFFDKLQANLAESAKRDLSAQIGTSSGELGKTQAARSAVDDIKSKGFDLATARKLTGDENFNKLQKNLKLQGTADPDVNKFKTGIENVGNLPRDGVGNIIAGTGTGKDFNLSDKYQEELVSHTATHLGVDKSEARLGFVDKAVQRTREESANNPSKSVNEIFTKHLKATAKDYGDAYKDRLEREHDEATSNLSRNIYGVGTNRGDKKFDEAARGVDAPGGLRENLAKAASFGTEAELNTQYNTQVAKHQDLTKQYAEISSQPKSNIQAAQTQSPQGATVTQGTPANNGSSPQGATVAQPVGTTVRQPIQQGLAEAISNGKNSAVVPTAGNAQTPLAGNGNMATPNAGVQVRIPGVSTSGYKKSARQQQIDATAAAARKNREPALGAGVTPLTNAGVATSGYRKSARQQQADATAAKAKARRNGTAVGQQVAPIPPVVNKRTPRPGSLEERRNGTGQQPNGGFRSIPPVPPTNTKTPNSESSGPAGLGEQVAKLDATISNFAKVISGLKIPDSISLKRDGKIEVVFNGAEVLASIDSKLKDMVNRETALAISEQLPRALGNLPATA